MAAPRPRLAPLLLAALSLVALAALVAGGAWAEYAFAAAAACFPGALIALGATRGGRLAAPVGWTAVALAAVLAACLAALLAWRGAAAAQPLAGGWPASLTLLLAGVWLLPLAFVGLAYALTFRRHGVGAADLERLHRLAAARREDG